MKKPVRFGRYYLLERIAVGGMAEVFKAKLFGPDGFNRLVALKRILPHIAEDEDFITMFKDEAQIAATLNHANIVQIFELGYAEDTYYIAMEYIHGKDLRTIFERSRRNKRYLDPKLIAYVMARVCEGLDYAHRKKDDKGNPLNIVHRDVSPQNIILSYEGDVKIIDFGVAKAQNKIGKTQAGILKGKFAYMSPEQIIGQNLDQRSDIFSLGIVFYELLTSERLFVGESDFHTLELVRQMKIVPPHEKRSDIPAELSRIVMKALERDKNKRYTYASEMHEDLQRFLFSNQPVFSRQHLAAFLREAFKQDLERDKKKTAAYEAFFEELFQKGELITLDEDKDEPSTIINTIDESPAPKPNLREETPSNPGGGGYPYPSEGNMYQSQSSFNPAQPMYQTSSGVFPQQSSAYAVPNQQTKALDPALINNYLPTNSPGFNNQTTEFSPSYQNGYEGDIGESTILDPSNGFGSSPYAPLHPPSAEQDVFKESAELLDDETPTIIEEAVEEEESSPRKKWLIFGIIGLILILGGGGVGAWFFVKGFGEEEEQLTAKYTISFKHPARGAQFYLNKKPFPKEDIKWLSDKRVELIFKTFGKFTLTIKKKGVGTFKRMIEVNEGDEFEPPPISLLPQKGILTVRVTPIKGAVVFIDGKRQKRPPPGPYQLKRGRYKVVVMAKGYKPEKKIVLIKPNAKLTLKIKLTKTKPLLQITCKEKDKRAKVYIDHRYRGRTPLKLTNLSFDKSYSVKVVPYNSRDPSFQAKLSFQLNPYHKLLVSCTKPKVGWLNILSKPKAYVFLDEKKVGITPIKKLRLNVGKHKLKFIQINDKKQVKLLSITVREGRNTDLVVTFK